MFVSIPLQSRAAGSPWTRGGEALVHGSAPKYPGLEIRSEVLGHLEGSLEHGGSLPLDAVVYADRPRMRGEVFERLGKASFAHAVDPGSGSLSGWYNPSILIVSMMTDMSREPGFPDPCLEMGLCDYGLEADLSGPRRGGWARVRLQGASSPIG